MAKKQVAIYLSDHLAGSVTVLELLSHLAALPEPSIKSFAAELRGRVIVERNELQGLLDKSWLRQSFGWIAEEFGQLQLRPEYGANGTLNLPEAIGLVGKSAPWQALVAVAGTGAPELQGLNFELRRRGEQQSRVKQVCSGSVTRALALC